VFFFFFLGESRLGLSRIYYVNYEEINNVTSVTKVTSEF